MPRPRDSGIRAAGLLATALALSIGWGVRGQWGHEYGAIIPGALAALAGCIWAGRSDWLDRWVWFAFLGALGWSLGGSMSYGLIRGHTRSGEPARIAYGFAMVFIIGFLWGFPGGAGTALAVVARRGQLSELVSPLLAVFAAWAFLDYGWERLWGEPPGWFDSDWLGVSLALGAALLWRLLRGPSLGVRLILWLGLGWWAGFLLFPVTLGLRMTPPRGDNWAGMVGVCAALALWARREGFPELVRSGLSIGLWSGFGFAAGQTIARLGEITGVRANWWSVMEQSYGFVSGVGIALLLRRLARSAPPASADAPAVAWHAPFLGWFLLCVMTWINISKNVQSAWIASQAVPEIVYGVPAFAWFAAAYSLVAVVVAWLALRVTRSSPPWLPASQLGRAQIFLVVLLWWIVLGNLSRVLPFNPGRVVTEGPIHLNACLLTSLILLRPSSPADAGGDGASADGRSNLPDPTSSGT